jgi:hypothetical protein
MSLQGHGPDQRKRRKKEGGEISCRIINYGEAEIESIAVRERIGENEVKYGER